MNNNNENFTEKNILDIRERLARISEEVHQERNRDTNHVLIDKIVSSRSFKIIREFSLKIV